MVRESYEGLVAWQWAVDFVVCIYRLTRDWPKEEQYGLTSQIRRAASIPANIAEGQGRNSPKEFVHFLGVANGSMREVEMFLTIAFRLQFFDQTIFEEVMNQATEVGKPLRGLIRRLRE